MTTIDMLTILLVSITAGFLGSMIGIGGAGIITPILVFFGVPVKYAIAAGMVTIIATSSGSASSYVKEGIANIKAGMYLEMFTILGAIVGAIITSIVAPKILYFVFSAVLMTSFFGVSSHARRKKLEEAEKEARKKHGVSHKDSSSSSEQLPLDASSSRSPISTPASSTIDGLADSRDKKQEYDPNADSNNTDYQEKKEQGQHQKNSIQERFARWLDIKGDYYDKAESKKISYRIERPLLGGICMFGAGIAAGMLGIGAGVFKVSIHELILKMPTKVSSTTSNFIIGITALAGSSIYFSNGLIFLNLAVPMAIGTTAGSILGGRILNRVRVKNLRVIFLVTVVFLISQMIYRGITVPS